MNHHGGFKYIHLSCVIYPSVCFAIPAVGEVL
jgi:hypothetical protein